MRRFAKSNSKSPTEYFFPFAFNRILDSYCEPAVQICGYNVKVIVLLFCKVFVKPTHMCYIKTQFFGYKKLILVSWTEWHHSNYGCDRLHIHNPQASISLMMTHPQRPI